MWKNILLIFGAFVTLASGCINFDFMLHNGVHCSKVSDKSCKNKDYWGKICLKCEEPYDFGRKYKWMETTLKGQESIRPIDNSKVVRHLVKTTDGEGELDAYFIPSHGENKLLAKTTILYNHGNYGGIEAYLPRLQMLYEIGFNIVVWDYRGYGKSKPSSHPNQEQFLSDSLQIRKEANKWAPDASKIIIYGFSLGGIPSVEMSLDNKACALLLEAPFPSVRSMVRSASTANMPEGFFSEARFNNIDKIKTYKGPLMVMIGDKDNKFTVRDQKELFDNATGPKEFWELKGVNHGIADLGIPEASFSEYTKKILAFLESKASACVQK